MQRIVLILVFTLAVLGGSGYVAGAWWFGKQLESSSQTRFAELQNNLPPDFKVSHTFQRGLFKSEETDTISFPVPSGNQPVRLSMETSIKHLPLAGLIHLEAASADSVLRLDPDQPDWTGGQPLANVHTAFRFNGSGISTISLPAFNSARLKSAAGHFQVNFTRDMASYTEQGSLPSLAIVGNQPGKGLTVAGFQINGTHALIAPYQHLYGGTDHVQISQFGPSDAGIGQIKQLTADSTLSSSGNGMVDMKVTYRMNSMMLAGREYGPAHFNLSLHHLDAATIDSMSQMHVNADAASQAEAMAAMQTLLMRDPEISIDRLSFNVPAGEALVTADVKVQGIQQSDFANPLAIVGKALIKANLKLPETLMNAMASRPSATPGMPAPNYGAKLDALVKAGYITRDGGFVSTHIEMSGGKLTLNGQPFNLLGGGN